MKRSDIICVAAVLLIAVIAVTACFFLNQDRGDDGSIKDCLNSVVEIKCESQGEKSYGTGFIVNESGLCVITCAHVVTHVVSDNTVSHDTISCSFYNSDTLYQLTVKSFDENKDIAILSFVDIPEKCTYLEFSKNNADYGDKAYVIGNSMNYGLSIKDGLVSVPKITVVKDDVKRACIMISVSVNSGDSGAPIIDSNNEVIGMVSFRLRDSGTTIQGMGYGVLKADILSYINKVSEHQQ